MSSLRKKLLTESILKDEMPDEVKQAIMQNRTSLGNNPAIPDIFDVPYLMKAMTSQFNDIKEQLSDMGSIDVDADTLECAIASLIVKCKKLEAPYRNELEKICVNYVIELLSVPEDSVELKVELVDDIDTSGEPILLDPMDGDGDNPFDDVESAVSIRSEVYKRRMLDAICMGAGMYVSENMCDSVLSEVRKFNPLLPDLYEKITVLNRYLLFMRDDFNMDDENKLQLGTVEVFLGSQDEKVTIHSQGEILPVLISETVRGFFELFISHGLPSDMETAKLIIGKADYLKAEPWDMKIGPHIWNMLSKSFNDVLFDNMPYLFKRISSLDTDKFNFLMKEVLAGTKKGRSIMGHLCDKAKEDSEYNKFVDKMGKMKTDNGIITDDYIRADEL